MIEVNNITKKYGRRKVLNGVTFTAEKGKITCLIGINGVGKSTIMKAIMGLTPINSGQILIDQQPIGHEMYEIYTKESSRLRVRNETMLKNCKN
ncbi:MAG: ATP-binding cassette domain-containing protein [Bacilli bacterium]